MQIITTYPIWFTIFCAALSGLYVFILYATGNQNKDLASSWKWLLGAMRFVVVFLIAFFLLNPLIKTIIDEKEQPIVVLAQDVSESITQNQDSTYYTSEYKAQFNALKSALEESYDVRTFTFGDKVENEAELSFADKRTDYSDLFKDIDDKFYNTNLAALILASDGLFNKGSHPLYYPFAEKYPIYSVGLGDTTTKNDFFFHDTRINEIAFLGNTFPIQVKTGATRLKGENLEVILSHKGKKLDSKSITVQDQSFDTDFDFFVKAEEPGIQKYTIEIKGSEKEFNLENNKVELYIDVLDNRQKILILTGAPHPDVAAIRSAIEKKENYEVTALTVNQFDNNFEPYNLVITHNLNRAKAPNALNGLNKSKVPVWAIVGGHRELRDMMSVLPGVSFRSRGGATEDYYALNNDAFGWFETSDNLSKEVVNWPPLKGPFGDIKFSEAWNPLYQVKIGSVSTSKPLFAFNRNDRKFAVLVGEGIWRWKMTDFVQHDNAELFEELVGKTIQLLSVKDDKRKFRINAPKQIDENEKLKISAELYNASFELVNDPVVKLQLENSKGEQFDFAFQTNGKSYLLDAGIFPAGEYKYKAGVDYEGNKYSLSGELTIKSIAIEKSVVTANHNLLYQLSQKTGGELIAPSNLGQVKALLDARTDIRTVVYKQKVLDDLINKKWIFFLILLLISIEWFVRKRSGLY